MKQVKQTKLDAINQRNRIFNPAAATAAVLASSVAMTQAHALDVGSALESSDAESNLETGALWAVGICLLIFGAKRVMGFFGR